jgi:hypothetical protein
VKPSGMTLSPFTTWYLRTSAMVAAGASRLTPDLVKACREKTTAAAAAAAGGKSLGWVLFYSADVVLSSSSGR